MADKTFLDYAREYADLSAGPSPFVPLKRRVPHYEHLTPAQLDYYLYWRKNIRRRKIVAPDQNAHGTGECNIAYVTLYFTELLTGAGTSDPAEAYEQMQYLMEKRGAIAGLPPGHLPHRLRHQYIRFGKDMANWSGAYLFINDAPRDQIAHHLGFYRGGSRPAWGAQPLRYMMIAKFPDLSPHELEGVTLADIANITYYARGCDRDEMHQRIRQACRRVNEAYVEEYGHSLFTQVPHRFGERTIFQNTAIEGDYGPVPVWEPTDDGKMEERAIFAGVVTTVRNAMLTAAGSPASAKTDPLPDPVRRGLDVFLTEDMGLDDEQCERLASQVKKPKRKKPTKAAWQPPAKGTAPDESAPLPPAPPSVQAFLDDESAPLTVGTWWDLISQPDTPGEERVIAIRQLRTVSEVSVTKDVWKHNFRGVPSLVATKATGSDEVELVPGEEATRAIALPVWSVKRLGLRPKDSVCITRRHERLFLKKFLDTERESHIPGWLVFDSFGEANVRRQCCARQEESAVTPELIACLKEQLAPLKHDPLPKLKTIEGPAGLIARQHLLGVMRKVDRLRLRAHHSEISAHQTANGSWHDSVPDTAFCLIMLAQAGGTLADEPVARGVDWLLNTAEPRGLPGMFGIGEAWLREYNRARRKGTRFTLNMQGRGKGMRDLEGYLEAVPTATNALEPWITGASTMALEALFRLGVDDQRVRRALNTIAAKGEGPWDALFGDTAKLPKPLLSPAACFDLDGRRLPSGIKHHDIDWFASRKALAGLTCGSGVCLFEPRAVSSTTSLLVKRPPRVIAVSMALHRALSFHPEYCGSHLCRCGLLELATGQSPDGNWPSYGGTMHWGGASRGLPWAFSTLVNHRCDLAAFLVLRSIPALIKSQRDDGFWDAGHGGQSRETVTVLILRTLKQFGLLERLLPN